MAHRTRGWPETGSVMLLAVTALFLMGQGGSAPDSAENRRRAAERYLAVVPLDGMMSDAIHALSRQVPEDKRERFVQLMTERLPRESLNRLAVDGLAKHFSVDELDALARFYGSSEGQAIRRKMGAYIGDLLPAIEREILRVANQLDL